jgi:hypothetical protein
VLAVGRRFSRTPRHSFSEPPSKQVSLGGWANVSFLAWLAPRRILGYEPAGFFLADPVTRKQLTAPQLPGVVPTRLMRADKLAVLVHGPPVEIARRRPCRYRCPGESPERATRRHQGRDPLRLGVDARRELCAVDPAGRAFVGGGRDEPVAEVDLRMLAVILTSPASRTTRWWSDAEMTA